MAKKGESLVPSWFKLDNAATIYPAAKTRVWSNVYRLSVVLTEDVDPEALRQTVKDVYHRFPTYFVQLRTGVFWNYLERVSDLDIVEEESYYPCEPIETSQNDKPLFRLYYYKRRISLEAFHAVADGGSAITMFKTVICRYFEIVKGIKLENVPGTLNLNESPTPEEWEDSFQKLYKPVKGMGVSEDKSYQYEPETLPNFYRVIFGFTPVEDLKKAGKKYNLNITEYVVAALLYALYQNAEKPLKKRIKLSVPIGLRGVFPTRTMRNFSLFTNVGFEENKNGETDMQYIADCIRGQIKSGAEKEKLQHSLSQNVGTQRNPILRAVPMVLKKPVLKIGYNRGQQNYVCSVSNLGVIKFPDEIQPFVDRFDVLLGGTPDRYIACGLVSDGTYMNISFTGAAKETPVERDFFRILTSDGLRVRIESNITKPFKAEKKEG